ncbi:MAG: RdgB/HAM1 family non-canonical purine NTP pyrophosphatase [Rhodanobacteraceae bacterium]
MKIVLASSNAGKLADLRELFAGSGIDVRAQMEFDVTDIEETGLSFVENAILKARHAARASGLPALGDDSGLCVDRLDGAPGLYSARYTGVQGNAVANIDKLLRALDGVPDEQRGAHFICVLALLRHAGDPAPLIAEGRWFGRIVDAPRGAQGFGYDPVFLPDDGDGYSAAELELALKNRISHRGQALVQLCRKLADMPLPLRKRDRGEGLLMHNHRNPRDASRSP